MEARYVETRDDEQRDVDLLFYRGEVPKKSKNRDKTLRSSNEFEKVSPQSGIVRRGRGVESRYHREVKRWSCGTMAKIKNRQKVVKQKGSRGWKIESKAVRQERTRR